jgi:hypothetical protein
MSLRRSSPSRVTHSHVTDMRSSKAVEGRENKKRRERGGGAMDDTSRSPNTIYKREFSLSNKDRNRCRDHWQFEMKISLGDSRSGSDV